MDSLDVQSGMVIIYIRGQEHEIPNTIHLSVPLGPHGSEPRMARLKSKVKLNDDRWEVTYTFG